MEVPLNIKTYQDELNVLRYMRKCVQELRKLAREKDIECDALIDEGMKLLEKYDAL